jgi:predicted SAM-dependent methyltransferase
MERHQSNYKIRRLPILKDFPYKIDCGCSDQKKEGYIGIDIDEWGQEIRWDLRDGIPFPDESVSDINVCHFMEHLTNQESKAFIREAQRVLINNGTLTARHPHVKHPTAFYPDHESFWNEQRVESINGNEPGWEIEYNFSDNFEHSFQLKKVETLKKI